MAKWLIIEAKVSRARGQRRCGLYFINTPIRKIGEERNHGQTLVFSLGNGNYIRAATTPCPGGPAVPSAAGIRTHGDQAAVTSLSDSV